MTYEEKRRLARQRILNDLGGVPCWLSIEECDALEDEYIRRIELEELTK